MINDFNETKAKMIFEIFKNNGYEVEYNDHLGFYINKKNKKYSEIVAIEYGYYGFVIHIERSINTNLVDAEEFLKELKNDIELLKSIEDCIN